MKRPLRLAWAAIALTAAIVVPLRVAEIIHAHHDNARPAVRAVATVEN